MKKSKIYVRKQVKKIRQDKKSFKEAELNELCRIFGELNNEMNNSKSMK